MLVRYLGIISAVACCGCGYSIRSTAIGPSVAPREKICAVDFSRQRPQDLSFAYEQVGVICFGSLDNVDDEGYPIEGRWLDVDRVIAYKDGRRHEAVRREACALGGELVAPVGVCGRFPYHLELGVWRKKRAGG
jgi:hypothetical protein